MLLFITGEDLRDYIGGKFQYISCYSLSYLWQNRAALDHVSIHLMLLFIQRETEVICSEVPVSIHLMLLFIEVSGVGSAVVEAFQYISCCSLSNCKEYRLYKQKGFNTSHVTLYRKPGTAKLPAESSFNTSHVTLYLRNFQRIRNPFPCFNTSHVTLYQDFFVKKSDDELSFNTSHVTLYLEEIPVGQRTVRFQYISCYSLSAN